MEQDRRLELIDDAIQKVIHDNNITNKAPESHHNNDVQYQNALSHLLSVSQFNVLNGEEIPEQFEGSRFSGPVASAIEVTEGEDEEGGERRGSENDEIMKELKKVKRQNFVTHCLLSAMIVLTVTWQLSEVSLILQLKDGLSHPFRSFGNMLKGMVKVPDMKPHEADDNEQLPESLSLPSMMIPDMSHIGN
ncbi:hypothetical protein PHAVU_001G262900 [Phaseolus vulgaris]|uniref:Uncharacterized protein n=1 Tax=Phaseolus vulgaris TaxID=3885 RepID=V7D257_PHAVU|nr:hypothetical protein PHAVU_001G262900g [Phaseolus vulgaris]ESW35768.1 hypothetical protein PHAVU_001G262900g [Phaseolus vulgaris]